MYNYQARGNPFAYRKPMVKKIPIVVTEVAAEDVWAAAAAADRINLGFYHKETRLNEDGSINFEPNRAILKRTLTDNSATEADRELGRQARAWHRGQMLMTALKRPLTGFEINLQKAADMDTFALEIHQLEIATIASQIRSYRTGVATEQRMFATDTSPLAPVGAKVTTLVEVVKSVYSQNYGTYYITAVTEKERKVVRFAYREVFAVKEGFAVGASLMIKGKVKAHNADGTQLHYVKVL